MVRDWRNEPRSCAYGGFAVLTREEQDAWDEHEAYLIAQGQHDRAAYMADRRKAHNLNRAICAAIVNQAPWED